MEFNKLITSFQFVTLEMDYVTDSYRENTVAIMLNDVHNLSLSLSLDSYCREICLRTCNN